MAIKKLSSQKVANKSTQATATPAPAPVAHKFRYQQVLQTTETFYLNAKLADVHFLFGSVRVPAHKHVLAKVSDVFERMFFSELKEMGDVTIVDASAAVFKEFLQFFYLLEINLTAEHMIDVLYLGHKYNVNECINACVGFLKENVTDENVCAILTSAIFFEHHQLLKICEVHIKSRTVAVIKSTGFLECHREVLARILLMNLLSCSDVEVFEACMTWVKVKSERDILSKEIVGTHLGALFNKIPFASMSLQQFCKLAAKYNLVFRRDFHSISNMIALTDFQFNRLQCQTKWNAAAIVKSVQKSLNFRAKLLILRSLIFFVCNLFFYSLQY